MKLLTTVILLAVAATAIHTVAAHPQYTITPQAVTEHITYNSWWAWLEEKQTLAFCIGTDINQRPVCTAIPSDKYVVIEYFTPRK